VKLSITRPDGSAIAVEADTRDEVEHLLALVIPPTPPDTEPPVDVLRDPDTELALEVEHLREIHRIDTALLGHAHELLREARREIVEGTDLARKIDSALRG
jgi:hypothetical protein